MSEQHGSPEPPPDDLPTPPDGLPLAELAFVAVVAAVLVSCALLILIADR